MAPQTSVEFLHKIDEQYKYLKDKCDESYEANYLMKIRTLLNTKRPPFDDILTDPRYNETFDEMNNEARTFTRLVRKKRVVPMAVATTLGVIEVVTNVVAMKMSSVALKRSGSASDLANDAMARIEEDRKRIGAFNAKIDQMVNNSEGHHRIHA